MHKKGKSLKITIHFVLFDLAPSWGNSPDQKYQSLLSLHSQVVGAKARSQVTRALDPNVPMVIRSMFQQTSLVPLSIIEKMVLYPCFD